MTALVWMGINLGVVAVGYMFMGKAIEVYHRESDEDERGGTRRARKPKKSDTFLDWH